MAPPQKRRRVDNDEPRHPKKKPNRRYKKQVDYHSSSSEEDEDGVRINKNATADKAEGPNAEPVRPRSILKHKVAEPKIAKQTGKGKKEPGVENVEDGNGDEDGDAMDGVTELEANTALNMAANDSSASDDDDDLSAGIEEASASSASDTDISTLPTDTTQARDAPSTDASSSDADDDSDDASETSTTASGSTRQRKKRNDPSAFATSISRILSSKLTTSKRSDPVLSRSASASAANTALADQKLETKARAQIRAEKHAALEKGRVKDVLALDDAGVDTGAVMEEEKRLKKTAQRGVVRLFNAVRAAQVKGEQAAEGARAGGVVGVGQREEVEREGGKEGFLELISRGGRKEVGA